MLLNFSGMILYFSHHYLWAEANGSSFIKKQAKARSY